MNKRKKVAWHKHLAAAKKHKIKERAERAANPAPATAKKG